MTPHISTTLLRTQSDERLARLAAEGHERAFEAIVERYRRPLTRFAQRFVGEARAEEVVQTAFLNAWNSLRSGTEVRDLKPWLYRIVNNGAINALQRAEYSDAPLIEASDTRLGPEAAFEQSEELRLTVEGIGDLPERQREALLAVAVDGRAHADVARDLGVSDAGVRQLVRRARVQLRAAATAITPIPLAVWLAKGGVASASAAAGGTAAGSAAAGGSAAGSTAAGTAAGGAALGGAVKAGAVVASMAVVATGGTEVVKKVEEKDSGNAPVATVTSARPGERTLIPGADPTMLAGGGPARVRMMTGADGRVRVVVDAPAPGAGPMTVGAPGDYVAGASPEAGPHSGPGRGNYQVADVFSQPTIPTPAPGRGGRGGSGTPVSPGGGPREIAEAPSRSGGEAPGSGKGGSGGGRDDRPASSPVTTTPKPDRTDSGDSGKGGSGGGRDDRPASSPVTTTPKPDRPGRTDSGDSGSDKGGSGKGDSGSDKGGSGKGESGKGGGSGGRSTSGEEPAPAKGGSGKGGSGGKSGGKDRGDD